MTSTPGAGAMDAHTTMFSSFVRAGQFVFVSGQASVDPDGTIIPGTFADEMRRSVGNVRRVLAQAGLTLAHVVKVGAYVRDPADLPEYNRIYAEYFEPPRPARTTITSCLDHRVKFEIDVVAYAHDSGRASPDGDPLATVVD